MKKQSKQKKIFENKNKTRERKYKKEKNEKNLYNK